MAKYIIQSMEPSSVTILMRGEGFVDVDLEEVEVPTGVKYEAEIDAAKVIEIKTSSPIYISPILGPAPDDTMIARIGAHRELLERNG